MPPSDPVPASLGKLASKAFKLVLWICLAAMIYNQYRKVY